LNVQMADSSAAVPAAAAKQSKRTVEGGVVVEDVKEGHGPEAKPGKLVSHFHKPHCASACSSTHSTMCYTVSVHLSITSCIVSR